MIRRPSFPAAALLVAATSGLAGCRLPEFAPAGEPANVAAAGGLAVATLAEQGFAIRERGSAAPLALVAPPAGSDRVDDVALDGELLFVLDALEPGALTVYSLADPRAPRLVDGPREVPVGPFSGVAAANGVAIVSGGTSELTLHRYARDGRLHEGVASLDLGRGQPDVVLSRDGRLAVVSTHFSFLADTFGFTTLALDDGDEHARDDALPAARIAARVTIDGAGYAPGGARPANFPLEAALDGPTLAITAAGSLALFDVADPAAPRALATLPLPFAPVSVDLAGGLAVAVGSSPAPTLAWIDVSDRSRPRLLATVPLPASSRPTGVALAATDGPPVAVVAAGGGGLLWIDAP